MSTTTQLLKASYKVLRQDKRLIALPAAAIATEAVVLAIFAVPYLVSPHGLSRAFSGVGSTTYYILLAVWYLVSTSISTFFNTALFFAADRALRGEEPDVRDALTQARRRIPTILAWSLLSSTVALVVQAIDRRIPVMSLILGLAWSCVSYLMLPVMVFEGVGVREGMRRTKHLFRATWGKEVVGSLRLGGIGVLLAIPGFVMVVLGLMTGGSAAIVSTIVAAVLWIGLCMLVLSCLGNIFRIAVYQYAATGNTAPQFDGIDLSKAFRPRGRRWS